MSHNFDKDQTRYVDDGVFTMGCLCDACKSNWTPIPAFPPVAVKFVYFIKQKYCNLC